MCRRMCCLLILFLAVAAHGQTWRLGGLITGRVAGANGPPSWLQNRYGRLDVDRRATLTGELDLDWTPSRYFTAHAHGIARGRASGLVSAFAQAEVERGSERWQLRAGQFFLPTSRENRGDLWSSPYTINFSAWNSWIAQEFRPIGVDLQWRHTTSRLNALTLGATAFRGNDTMGALLAWRGWTVGSRLSVYDEVVPLPALWSLPLFIPAQRRDGTTALTADLDGRTGYAARGRWTFADRALVQLTRVDNRGDNRLYGDEYSWATTFDLLGFEAGSSETTIFAAEAASGRTSMGSITAVQPRRYANVAFSTAYALLSHKRERNRYSLRLDAFRTNDRDGSPGETNDENGLSWTVAYFRDLSPRLRAGAELVQVTGDRPAAAESGFSANTDAQSVTIELRYSFP